MPPTVVKCVAGAMVRLLVIAVGCVGG